MTKPTKQGIKLSSSQLSLLRRLRAYDSFNELIQEHTEAKTPELKERYKNNILNLLNGLKQKYKLSAIVSENNSKIAQPETLSNKNQNSKLSTKNLNMLVITGPSGAGKSTVIKHLLSIDKSFELAISCTSRKMREGDKDGKTYYFLSPEEFKKKIDNNDFIEYEEVYKNLYYGTPKSELERIQLAGKVPILDIEVEGARNIKRIYGDNVILLFIEPPSYEELERRLRARGTESESRLQERLIRSDYELSYKDEFDLVLTNNEWSQSIAKIEYIARYIRQNKNVLKLGQNKPLNLQSSGKFKLLTDIKGEEDHYGKMDFKITGTKNGITAMQLDNKAKGLSIEVLNKAIVSSKAARLGILDKMNVTISKTAEMGQNTPRVESIYVPKDKIGEVIGSSGKIIKALEVDFDVKVDLDNETGNCYIYATNKENALACKQKIARIVNGYKPGEVLQAKVFRIETFGAFVHLIEEESETKTEGMIHISKLSEGRVPTVESVVNIGQVVSVEVIEINKKGQIALKLISRDNNSQTTLNSNNDSDTKNLYKKPNLDVITLN